MVYKKLHCIIALASEELGEASVERIPLPPSADLCYRAGRCRFVLPHQEYRRASAEIGTLTACPDSNFCLQQSCSSLALQVCKLAASLTRQDHKFITSLKQIFRSDEVTMCRTCSKLFTSSSFQTSRKKRERIRTPEISVTNLLP
ncbi:hypothetical protein AVEN_45042-1 [Araneus ventricosus]|uniref:Uncharacterized protein n=1 Tax=Araneus ventricosus TaxID=182803 RepID=A0A4Y2IQX1_ARAVE|nr:hypothetical protein AVEN_45042-1 [Araneus ventricosus]